MELHEILYLNIFRKSVDKIQVSLKSDNNNGLKLTNVGRKTVDSSAICVLAHILMTVEFKSSRFAIRIFMT